MPFTIYTDHKPLVPLFASKELAKLPTRIQRFLLRVARYGPDVIHVPESNQIVADARSRAPSSSPNEKACSSQKKSRLWLNNPSSPCPLPQLN
ncbi:Pol polyprotein [Plakobranchus ocellatus]|uniref:Pol polyprotein n=1 Tax=Plakobranchus ocellatus TaxID=259542 RepID=A0AAV4CDN0_9GAST|nr:Pol polyprotein [Plakobranchus ocellatus]